MKTKYDWSNVPDEINWIATDSDGHAFGYAEKPYNGGSYWYALNPKHIKQSFNGNWQDSLEECQNEN